MKRYMLMLLLSAGTLVTGLESYAQDSAGREQAVEAIRKLGGEVIIDSTKPGTPVSVVLTGSGKPADCLLHLKDLGNLHTCDL